MSHEESDAEQYHEASPLRRYFDTVSIYELTDPTRASEIHERAYRDLQNLFEALSVDVSTANMIIDDILPDEYDPREFSFEEWQTLMRLVPMQLLCRAIPDSETITTQYIGEAINLTMGNCSEHSTPCLDDEMDRLSCESSLVCPARLTRNAGLRTAALLTLSVYALKPNPLGHFMEYQMQYQKIQALEIALARRGLVSTKHFREFTKNMHEHIQDEFNNDRYMMPPSNAE